MSPEEQGKNREAAGGRPPSEHRFRPGQSGNPGGRPAGRSLAARVRELLDRDTINDQPIKDGKQVADLLAEVIVRGALKGDFRYVQFLYDRISTSGEIDDIWRAMEEIRGGGAGPDLGRAGPAAGSDPSP